tara:strand:+ start:27191 stop:27832 length:642 start_codon:yes stop_codon:yes gene_type:complete
MKASISERLADIDGRIVLCASKDLSCLEATKLAYIQEMLDRAKTYLVRDSQKLSSKLIAKAERVFHLLELGFTKDTENAELEANLFEDSDEPRLYPAKQFILLREDIQKSRLAFSNNKESEARQVDKNNNSAQSCSDLQSFGEYQVMFEKMALDRLLSKVMQQIPENAGPLNPERLVVRSFKALQDISPEYLKRLISYYESLLILQAVNSSFK